MSDKRKFATSFSVKVGTQRTRVELSEAPVYGGPEGLYRVRINRRWHDCPDGSPRFMDRATIAALVVDMSLSELAPLPPCPAYHPKARASVRYTEHGIERCEQATLKSQPVRLYDGKIYVCVHTYEKGTWFAPWEDIIIRGIYYGPRS